MQRDPHEIIPPPEVAIPIDEERDRLPSEVPTPPELEFTARGGGWPPQPRDRENVRTLRAEPVPGALTEDFELDVRRAAARDRRARVLLGERFVHLSTEVRRPAKGCNPDPCEPIRTTVLFFSHSNNVTVEVLMEGLLARASAIVPGVQPPEVPEEVEQAVELARTDPRLADAVRGLAAGALLLPFRDGELGYGHRIIWVTFFASGELEDEKPALVSAAVDLTDRRVLLARREAPIEGPSERRKEASRA